MVNYCCFYCYLMFQISIQFVICVRDCKGLATGESAERSGAPDPPEAEEP